MVRINVIPILPGDEARFNTRAFERDVNNLMRDVVADGNRFIARYPAQRLRKTRYRRTNTLKRSWSFKVRKRGNNLEGIVGSNSNIAPYNTFVQGRRQVRIFRGAGWQNVDDLADRMLDDFEDGLEAIMIRHTR